MRTSHLIFSAIQFLVTLTVLLAGAFFILIPYAPTMQSYLGDFFLGEAPPIQKLGIVIFGFGALCFFVLFRLNRTTYLELHMKGCRAHAEEGLVKGYVDRYLHELFPNDPVDSDVVVLKKNRLEVIANLPTLREDLLEKIQHDLGLLFYRQFGYSKDFCLKVKLA